MKSDDSEGWNYLPDNQHQKPQDIPSGITELVLWSAVVIECE